MRIQDYQFKKSERIVSQKQIDKLFGGDGSHSKAAFPVRVVYNIDERKESQPSAQVLISVPKRRFRHAVDRNRVKRQIREAYRKNKQLLVGGIPEGKKVSVAFVWLSDKHMPSQAIEDKVKSLLTHLAKELLKNQSQFHEDCSALP